MLSMFAYQDFFIKGLTYEKFILEFINGYKIYVMKNI
jgi:hypothetical protein